VREPWYVAAGWALDLFLGGKPREHEDIEIGVPAVAFASFLPFLRDCELFVIGPQLAYPIDSAADRMDAHHQTWVRDAGGAWRLDIFREPSAGGMWVARRDPRIRMAYEHLILRHASGVPFARPEVVLLFKAKARRPKDEQDFARVLPRLDDAARAWLADALELAHPGHAWLAALR
jgi:hypothetical protein